MNTMASSTRLGAKVVFAISAIFLVAASTRFRYHQPEGRVRDIPSTETPAHPGHWSVHWMKPEPMHAIETVENYYMPGDPPSVRVEIKVRP